MLSYATKTEFVELRLFGDAMEFDRSAENTAKAKEADNGVNLASLTASLNAFEKQSKPVERVAIEPKSGDSFGQRPGDGFPQPFPFPPGGGWGGGWGNGFPDGGIILRGPNDGRPDPRDTRDPRLPKEPQPRVPGGDSKTDPNCPCNKPHRPLPQEWEAVTPEDPLRAKLWRETVVIGGGTAESFLYGTANLHKRLPEIGTSMAIGAGLSAITKSGKGGAAAATLVGIYFAARFVANTINDDERWTRASNAVVDTWNNPENTTRNMHEFSLTAGNFAFDTTVTMGAGYIGYHNKPLADLIFQILRFPMPLPAPVPVAPGSPQPRAPEPRTPFPALGNVPMWLEIAPPQGSLPWPDTIIPDWRKRWLDRHKEKSLKENIDERLEKPAVEQKPEAQKPAEQAKPEEKKPEPAKEQTKPPEFKFDPSDRNRLLFAPASQSRRNEFVPQSVSNPEQKPSNTMMSNEELKRLLNAR